MYLDLMHFPNTLYPPSAPAHLPLPIKQNLREFKKKNRREKRRKGKKKGENPK